MVIAHNISAINTYNKMGVSNKSTDKSMEKLSSGYRINRAADDAAGLSISEKMRSQIRGLTQASTNAENGVSMIQTAEGALNEAHSILQRMRELAVQAANDTNAASDREALQSEIDQLTSEINRIGNTTEFNGMKILNGSKVKIEAGSVDVEVTGGSTAAKNLSHNTGCKNDGNLVFKGDGITIANTTVPVPTATLLNGEGKNTITIRKNGNALEAQVLLTKSATEYAQSEWVELSLDADGTSYSYGNNGVSFSITKDSVQNAIDNLSDGQVAASLDLSIAKNASATFSAVGSYTLDEDYSSFAGGTTITGINLKATDDTTNPRKYDYDTVNIEYNHSTSSTTSSVLKVEFLKGGTKVGTEVINMAGDVDDDTYAFNTNGLSFTLTRADGATAGKTSASIDLIKWVGTKSTTKIVQDSDNSVYFHVGANMDQVINTTFGDMRAAALGLTGSGEAYTSKYTVNDGSKSTLTERGLNISTRKGANLAIDKIDHAIQEVSKERSKYGAIQNRLEYTINNIDTTTENMTSAESTIRDVDMASEMMEMTKSQILQQASQAMLAQAMQRPQQVLQLLQG